MASTPRLMKAVLGGIRENSCVLCGATSRRIVWSENGYESRACACGVTYTTPLPPAGAVDPTADGHPATFYRLPAVQKVRWLSRHRPGGTLLEVGCGDGYVLEAAQQMGYSVAGIEADPVRAARTAARLRISVEASTIEASAWAPGTCDVVWHCDLLSHFADPVSTLERMSRLLRPGGLLFFEVGIMTPRALGLHRWIESPGLPQHRWFYSATALSRLLQMSHLDVVATRRFGLLPVFIAYGLARRPWISKARSTTPRNTADPGRIPWREAGEQLGERSLPESPMQLLRAQVHNALRYRVGRLAPKIGPQTWLVLATPRKGL